MNQKANEKNAIATDDIDWARAQFGFAWGDSSLVQRLQALENLVGSQIEIARLAGIKASTYRSVVWRQGGMSSERIGALAKGTGLSLNYLVYGTPESARDAACEEQRFDLAVQAFQVPSSPNHREGREFVIAEQRAELDVMLERFGFGQLGDRRLPMDGTDLALLQPLRAAISEGTGATHPALLSLSRTWLGAAGFSAQQLRYLLVAGTEGGDSFAANSILLVDITDTTPEGGTTFVMDIGGELQLRRMATRLTGKTDLVHLNPAWPNETVEGPEDAPIKGRVVMSLGRS